MAPPFAGKFSALKKDVLEDTQPGAPLNFAAGDIIVSKMMLGKLVDTGRFGVEFHAVIDLRDQYEVCQIVQDIENPFLICQIRMSNATQLVERIGSKGLQGEEFIQINFNTPSREQVELLFHVGQITPVKQTEHSTGSYFNILCHTKEKIIQDTLTINKAYTSTIADAVENIFKNYLQGSSVYKIFKTEPNNIWKDREITIDPTVGVQDFIVPGLQPLEAMQWLANRAFGGSEFPASYYAFYEDSNGFHFANIERLIKDGKKSGPIFTFDPNAADKDVRSKQFFRSIQSLSGMSIPSASVRINDGTFKHNVRTIDMIHKKTIDQSFDMKESFNKFEHTGAIFNNSSGFFDQLSGEPFEYLLTKDMSKLDANIDNITGKRLAYINLMTSFKCIAQVFGDSNLNVGQLVYLDLPEPGTDEQRSISMYRGYYLITGLEHTFDKEKHNTTLSLTKDALEPPRSRETG